MQYVIRWNPAVLRYLTIDSFQLPNLSLNNFNTQRALDSGIVKLLWEGPSFFPGISRPDNATIFRLRFNVIGPDTSSTAVRFTEITNTFPFLDFEVLKVISPDSTIGMLNEQQCKLKNGFVAVGFTVDTKEPQDPDALQLTLAPNPFSENTQVEFYIAQTADVQAIVTDVSGRILFQKDMPQLPSGKHGININKAIFPAKGAYFLTIRTGSQSSTRTLICN